MGQSQRDHPASCLSRARGLLILFYQEITAPQMRQLLLLYGPYCRIFHLCFGVWGRAVEHLFDVARIGASGKMRSEREKDEGHHGQRSGPERNILRRGIREKI